VIEVNDAVKRRMIDKIIDLADGSLNGKRIAVLGVTFKPNTDDMRDSPALSIVPALVGAGAEVRVTDPQGQKEGQALLPGVEWCEDAYAASTEADMCLLLTEWNDFRALDLRGALFADLRNVYGPEEMDTAGFQYISIGRGEGQAKRPG